MATDFFFGHRGYSSLYPENTMLAFKKAIEAGACGLELDVVKSVDGVLFVMHDDAVDRTTNGTGKCSELNWDYIDTLDAGSSKSEKFTGERVPSLEEVLDYFNHIDCWILIEIKNGYTDIAADVASMITAKGMEDQVKVQSFNWGYMEIVKEINPCICTGLLGTYEPTTQLRALSGGHDFLSLNSYTQKSVNDAHTYGFTTFVWTENTYEDIQHYIGLNIDGIIGNDVALLMEAAEDDNIQQCYPPTVSSKVMCKRKKEKKKVTATLKKNPDDKWLRY